MLKCKFGCNRLFQTQAAMDDHRKTSHKSASAGFLPAVKKRAVADCSTHIQKHVKVASATLPQNVKVVICKDGCNRQFQSQAAMDAHRLASHPGALARPPAVKKTLVVGCNDCTKTFTSVDALRHHQHTSAQHIRPARGVGSFACDNCNRTLRSQDSLEQHFVADHSNSRDSVRVQLVAHFNKDWRKPSRPGRVLSVFRVYNPGWRILEFNRHRQQLQSSGNEVPRYHGTTLLCDLGSGSENSKLCGDERCHLCSILRTGFKTVKARDTWQRFGKGIYTTAISGKSDDYICSNSSQRAVLVCRVLAGNVFRTQTNMPTLTAPRKGMTQCLVMLGRISIMTRPLCTRRRRYCLLI
ncbi:unnamed protein product [Calypogeia fissa]